MHWLSPNSDATNSSGFTGLPGGLRGGSFLNMRTKTVFWTSTSESGIGTCWASGFENISGIQYSSNIYSKVFGFSVRCIKS